MPERTAMTPRIKWVCVSDLHLGALNSLLTNVTDDGEHVDGTTPSPVLTALCHCIRSLRRPGQDPPQLVVLGDLFELALTSLEDAAVTFSQFMTALDADTDAGAVAPRGPLRARQPRSPPLVTGQ